MAKLNSTEQSVAQKAISAAKIMAGSLLMAALPGRRQRMQRVATIPWHDKQQPDAIDRLIRGAILWWRSRDDSGEQLAALHQDFWREQSAEEYYAGTHNRFEKVFMPHFDHYLDQLATLALKRDSHCLIEIGCGEGQLLRHMQQRVPLQRHVGIDLSEDQIARNQQERASDGPEYFAGDASEWINANAPANAVYVTGLGVLEYFTEAKLNQLLGGISQQRSPACALFIEPVDPNADFDNFDSSYPAGEEHSFTHNYAKRLEQNGWSLELCEEVKLDTYRWLVMLASCEE